MKVKHGLKATIVAMAAITTSNMSEELAAARAAFADIASETGESAIIIPMDPFGGMIA